MERFRWRLFFNIYRSGCLFYPVRDNVLGWCPRSSKWYSKTRPGDLQGARIVEDVGGWFTTGLFPVAGSRSSCKSGGLV